MVNHPVALAEHGIHTIVSAGFDGQGLLRRPGRVIVFRIIVLPGSRPVFVPAVKGEVTMIGVRGYGELFIGHIRDLIYSRGLPLGDGDTDCRLDQPAFLRIIVENDGGKICGVASADRDLDALIDLLALRVILLRHDHAVAVNKRIRTLGAPHDGDGSVELDLFAPLVFFFIPDIPAQEVKGVGGGEVLIGHFEQLALGPDDLRAVFLIGGQHVLRLSALRDDAVGTSLILIEVVPNTRHDDVAALVGDGVDGEGIGLKLQDAFSVHLVFQQLGAVRAKVDDPNLAPVPGTVHQLDGNGHSLVGLVDHAVLLDGDVKEAGVFEFLRAAGKEARGLLQILLILFAVQLPDLQLGAGRDARALAIGHGDLVAAAVGSGDSPLQGDAHQNVHGESLGLKGDRLAVHRGTHDLGLPAEVDHVHQGALVHFLGEQLDTDLHVLVGLILHARLGIAKADIEHSGEIQIRHLLTGALDALGQILGVDDVLREDLPDLQLRSGRNAGVAVIAHADGIGLAVGGSQAPFHRDPDHRVGSKAVGREAKVLAAERGALHPNGVVVFPKLPKLQLPVLILHLSQSGVAQRDLHGAVDLIVGSLGMGQRKIPTPDQFAGQVKGLCLRGRLGDLGGKSAGQRTHHDDLRLTVFGGGGEAAVLLTSGDGKAQRLGRGLKANRVGELVVLHKATLDHVDVHFFLFQLVGLLLVAGTGSRESLHGEQPLLGLIHPTGLLPEFFFLHVLLVDVHRGVHLPGTGVSHRGAVNENRDRHSGSPKPTLAVVEAQFDLHHGKLRVEVRIGIGDQLRLGRDVLRHPAAHRDDGFGIIVFFLFRNGRVVRKQQLHKAGDLSGLLRHSGSFLFLLFQAVFFEWRKLHRKGAPNVALRNFGGFWIRSRSLRVCSYREREQHHESQEQARRTPQQLRYFQCSVLLSEKACTIVLLVVIPICIRLHYITQKLGMQEKIHEFLIIFFTKYTFFSQNLDFLVFFSTEKPGDRFFSGGLPVYFRKMNRYSALPVDQELRDLDGVCGRALADLIAAAPEAEAVVVRQVGANAAHVDQILV